VVQEIGIGLVAGLELGNAAADHLYLPGNVDAEDLMFRPQQPQGGAREKGTSAIRSVSGGPYFSQMNAFMAAPSGFR
jgi:hypothetical protein